MKIIDTVRLYTNPITGWDLSRIAVSIKSLIVILEIYHPALTGKDAEDDIIAEFILGEIYKEIKKIDTFRTI